VSAATVDKPNDSIGATKIKDKKGLDVGWEFFIVGFVSISVTLGLGFLFYKYCINHR